MRKYFEPVAELVWFFFFITADLYTYYSIGRSHSYIPFYICLAATAVVGFFAGMAIYEIHKHRNDKESW